MYSQNQEDKYITDYFAGDAQPGILLSIGENDGITFSNVRQLILLGWGGVLVEPSNEAFTKLRLLYENNPKVKTIPTAIADKDGTQVFYDSGSHLGQGDSGLLSTLNKEELKRWQGTPNEFRERLAHCATWATFLTWVTEFDHFDFISIDAEGMDLVILRQIDLGKTRLLCIEWNSRPEVKAEIMEICAKFGLKNLIHQNAENLIIGR